MFTYNSRAFPQLSVYDRLERMGRKAISNFCDIAQLEIRSLTHTSDLCKHAQSVVHEDAYICYKWLRYYVTPTQFDCMNIWRSDPVVQTEKIAYVLASFNIKCWSIIHRLTSTVHLSILRIASFTSEGWSRVNSADSCVSLAWCWIFCIKTVQS